MKTQLLFNLDWNFAMANNIVLGKGFDAIYREEDSKTEPKLES